MTIEKARKMLDEEYKHAQNYKFIKRPLSYALYQVWKRSNYEDELAIKKENEE